MAAEGFDDFATDRRRAYATDVVLLFRLPFASQPLGFGDLFGRHMFGDLVAIPQLI
jgi:hypothetical protein